MRRAIPPPNGRVFRPEGQFMRSAMCSAIANAEVAAGDGGVPDVQDAVRGGEQEVVHERAVSPDRLRPNSRGRWEEICAAQLGQVPPRLRRIGPGPFASDASRSGETQDSSACSRLRGGGDRGGDTPPGRALRRRPPRRGRGCPRRSRPDLPSTPPSTDSAPKRALAPRREPLGEWSRRGSNP